MNEQDVPKTCYFSGRLCSVAEASELTHAEIKSRVEILKGEALSMLPRKPIEEYRALLGRVGDEWRLYVTSNGMEPTVFWKQEEAEKT